MQTYYKHRILILLTFYLFGIFLQHFCEIENQKILIILSITSLVFFIFKKKLIIFLIFIFLGFYQSAKHTEINNLNSEYLNKKISIQATLLKNPQKRKNSYRLLVKIISILDSKVELTINTKAVLYTKNKQSDLFSGDHILIKDIKLNEIEEFKNPGSFSLKKHFKKQGISYSAFINNSNQIEKINKKSKPDLFYKLNKFRKKYENFVRSNISFPNNEILIALSIGEKGGISEELRNKFSYLGISHLLAISGLHLGFIAIIFHFVIKWLLKRSQYIMLMYEVPKVSTFLTIIPLFLYTSIAGFATPVVRAFIMISLYLVSILLNKQNNKINILATAALVILIIDTNSIHSLSFQLSFLAVSGIILFNYLFPLKFNTIYQKIFSSIKTTVAATLLTLPLVINNFGYFPTFTIPANLIAVPIVEFLIVPIGLISIVFYLFTPSISESLISINNKILNFLISFADYLSSIEISKITIPVIDTIGYILFFLTLIALLITPINKKFKYLAFTFFILFTSHLLNNDLAIRNNLEINYLDSGNKSYFLINIPNGKRILISSGYTPYANNDFIEKAAVIPFLRSNGITKIDYFWLLSNSKSHINGAISLLDRINVDSIWTNGRRLDGKLWKIIKEKNINWKNLQKNLEEFSIHKTSFKFIKPRNFNLWDSKRPKPILLVITNSNNKFVLGEEIENNTIQEELIKFNKTIQGTDLIFLRTDKSKNDFLSNFINKIKPRFLILNSYKNSLELNNNIQLFETKSDGMITINSIKNKIVVNKYYQR